MKEPHMDPHTEKFMISAEDAGRRLDTVLAELMPDISRSAIQKLFLSGNVTLDGDVCREKKIKAAAGTEVGVLMPELRSAETEAEDIPLNIIYEDEDLMVIDKPRGMVVHPAPGNERGTLVNAALYHVGESLRRVGDAARPGVVHRIDKDTSGLLVMAKSQAAFEGLSAMFRTHDIERRYSAIVYGGFKEDEGRIEAPIGRDPRNRLRRAVGGAAARGAVTEWRVTERIGDFTLIEARLRTGRTHQIRVHMAYIGHPLLGDHVYGPRRDRLRVGGQVLHAGVLGFRHPLTGEELRFVSPLPQYFREALVKVRRLR